MGTNAIDEIGEFWDTKSSVFRKGKGILDAWHEQCRMKRIDARIAERKKQNALKMVQLEQERLIKKLSETDSKANPKNITISKQNRKDA